MQASDCQCMGNFRLLARDLVERGAACEVVNAAALAEIVPELFRDSARRVALAAAAAQWHQENSGAVTRTMTVIRAALRKL